MQAAHDDPWARILNKALDEVQSHETALCDFAAATLVLLLVAWCSSRRPRTTGAVVVAWLCWFAWQVDRGSAWREVARHGQIAAKKTAEAIRAVAEMLVAWVALFVPALHDLWTALCPLLVDLYASALWLWQALSWEERGLVALCGMGLGGAAYAMLRIWKARAWLQESSTACLGFLQQALFHLSFVVVGPAIWAASRQLGAFVPSVPSLVYFVVATLWPLFCTSRALLRHREEKAAKARRGEEEQKSRKWWQFQFRLKLPSLVEEFRMSTELEEEMCFWLSYWSCWPLLAAIQVTLESLNESDAGSSGLLIALALWLQYWKACFLAPYVFTILTSLFSQCIEYGASVIAAIRQLAFRALHRLPWQSYLHSMFQGDAVMAVVAAVILLLLCLKVASVVSVLITVILLFGVSMESARCVANEAHKMYADRLAFWVLVNCWLWFLRIPALGSVLYIWSPLTFAAAFFGGEAAFSTIFFAVLNALAAMLSCLNSAFKRPDFEERQEVREPLLEGEPRDLEAAHEILFRPPEQPQSEQPELPELPKSEQTRHEPQDPVNAIPEAAESQGMACDADVVSQVQDQDQLEERPLPSREPAPGEEAPCTAEVGNTEEEQSDAKEGRPEVTHEERPEERPLPSREPAPGEEAPCTAEVGNTEEEQSDAKEGRPEVSHEERAEERPQPTREPGPGEEAPCTVEVGSTEEEQSDAREAQPEVTHEERPEPEHADVLREADKEKLTDPQLSEEPQEQPQAFVREPETGETNLSSRLPAAESGTQPKDVETHGPPDERG
ncbi:unnamed protein product [Effrenium voratum]|nr:unnamed protein product [Effrenium voratum]